MGIVRAVIALSLLLALPGAPRAYAWPPKFGHEFTFTAPEFEGLDQEASMPARDRLGRKVRERCLRTGHCRVVEEGEGVLRSWKAEYPTGQWFRVVVDRSVAEVLGKPSDRREIARHSALLKRDLFDAAREAGLVPHEFKGGGHIHIDFRSAFGDDRMLFRNFLVDLANHPEVFHVWSGRTSNPNAMTISEHDHDARQRFRAVIDAFDRGEIETPRELAEWIELEVYRTALLDHPNPEKYQAVNLRRVAKAGLPDSERTVELRGIRPQVDVREYQLQLELIERRIEMLRRRGGEVAFADPRPFRSLLKAEEKFKDWVVETGMSLENYQARNIQVLAEAIPAPEGDAAATTSTGCPGGVLRVVKASIGP